MELLEASVDPVAAWPALAFGCGLAGAWPGKACGLEACGAGSSANLDGVDFRIDGNPGDCDPPIQPAGTAWPKAVVPDKRHANNPITVPVFKYGVFPMTRPPPSF